MVLSPEVWVYEVAEQCVVCCHFPSLGSRIWEGGKQDGLLRMLWVLHIPVWGESFL